MALLPNENWPQETTLKGIFNPMLNKTLVLQLGVVLLLAPTVSWAQSEQVGSLIPASNIGTYTSIRKPVLRPSGGALLLSDSPEQITDTTTLPAAFYRDSLQGSFRVFYHHQNVTANSLNIAVAITNTTTRTEILFSRGRGANSNYYPNAAGQSALADFLSNHRTVSFLALLAPGQTYYSVQENESGNTASGIEEYVLITLPGKSSSSLPLSLLQHLEKIASSGETEIQSLLAPGFSAGRASVTTLVYSGDQPTTPTSLPILTPDSDHIRGTFPHFDRLGTFAIDTALGVQGLDIDTAPPGFPYSDVMPGEYEYGVDAVDDGAKVYNNGNYGVLYKFMIAITEKATFATRPLGVLMQPTGGVGSYVMVTNGRKMLSPYVDYTSAWWFHEVISPRQIVTLFLETSLTGGSAGPQQLYFVPNFTGQ